MGVHLYSLCTLSGYSCGGEMPGCAVCIWLTVVGCANPALPPNVRVERVAGTSDRLIVRCDGSSSSSSSSGETWYLTCHGSRWLGIADLHNCTNFTLSQYSYALSVLQTCTRSLNNNDSYYYIIIINMHVSISSWGLNFDSGGTDSHAS